jgi:hypothetical protein
MCARARLLVLASVCLSATGCITSLTTINLQKDGSGTIEQTVTMNAAAAEQLAGMMQGLQDENAANADAEPELFSEAEMREATAKYGEGVTFVSSKPIKTANRVGRVATYSFSDISKLRINQKPATPGGDDMEMGDDEEEGDGDEPEEMSFRFSRQPSGTSLVTVVFPEPDLADDGADTEDDDGDDDAEAAEETPDPQQLAMLKQLFGDLKISINLDVDGEIVDTNSAYVDGSRVTLLEMEFSELLKNDQLLGQVAKPSSIEEAKALLKDVKGFKINLDREVKVEFK